MSKQIIHPFGFDKVGCCLIYVTVFFSLVSIVMFSFAEDGNFSVEAGDLRTALDSTKTPTVTMTLCSYSWDRQKWQLRDATCVGRGHDSLMECLLGDPGFFLCWYIFCRKMCWRETSRCLGKKWLVTYRFEMQLKHIGESAEKKSLDWKTVQGFKLQMGITDEPHVRVDPCRDMLTLCTRCKQEVPPAGMPL